MVFVWPLIEGALTVARVLRRRRCHSVGLAVPVSTLGTGKGYEESGYWEPKAAFQAIAERVASE